MKVSAVPRTATRTPGATGSSCPVGYTPSTRGVRGSAPGQVAAWPVATSTSA
ncbi:hypothetical protein ACUY2L_07710 [Corynebacterium mastitidis]